MTQIIKFKLDLKKIDLARVFKANSGAEYLDFDLVIKDINQPDQYDNIGFITQQATKAEREAKTKMPILGNAKLWRSGGQAPAAPAATRQAPTPPPAKSGNDFPDDDSVPF